MGGGNDDTTMPSKTQYRQSVEGMESAMKHQDQTNPGERTLIGQPPDRHWMHYHEPPMFDLTRPVPPEWTLPERHARIHLSTSLQDIVISPSKTALVIIDMQNFFLSPALGRKADGAGNMARKQLFESVIPAANAAGIQVIWLNHILAFSSLMHIYWGLTQQDIDEMPPSVLSAFGSIKERKHSEHQSTKAMDKPSSLYRGLGNELGEVKLEDGSVVEGGRMLMRDYWNTDLPPDLKSSFEAGRESEPAHLWIHKNRMSGLWDVNGPFSRFLQEHGICTLLFAGVNTDQCVGGTLQDAYSQGYDCIVLSDACGTSSPSFAKACIEYNTERSWGFVSNCYYFKTGVEEMLVARQANEPNV